MSTTNRVKKIHEFRQSIWLDFIERKLIKSGELKKLIDEDGVRELPLTLPFLRKPSAAALIMTNKSLN